MNCGRTERPLVLLILLAAVLLRLWRLEDVPPGLTHDEANNVHDAATILDGQRPFYFPVAQGKEPLYPYSVAGLMALFGRSPWVMRLCSAFWSLLLVVASYKWARSAFGPVVALLLAAGLATGFWPVSTARMGLRAIALPALFTTAAWLLWRGMALARDSDKPAETSLRDLLICGIVLGLSLYSYLASRVMPLVLILFALYQWLFLRKLSSRVIRGTLLILMVTLVVALPLFSYLNSHPAAEIRLGQLDAPLRALMAGEPALLWDRVRQTARMISFSGDTFVPYNIAGKPLLRPLMSALFYGGLVLAMWRWRQPAYAFALLWLIVGFAPALATGVEAANLRAIAAQPVFYLFPALGLEAVGSTFVDRYGGRVRLITVGCGMLLFAVVGLLTWRDYFYRWAVDTDVRVHYHVDLVAVTSTAVAGIDSMNLVSALYPGEYHDPRVVEAELGVQPEYVRWFDGRSSLALPEGERARLILPAGHTLDPVLVALVDLDLLEQVSLRPEDLVPHLDVYELRVRDSIPSRPLAQFGDALCLLQVDVTPQSLNSGAKATVLTVWQVTGRVPPDRDAVLFVQVLDNAGQVLAQDDRLEVPSWQWAEGDRFAQLLSLDMPAELPAGDYRLVLGAYTVPDRVDAVLAGIEPDPAMPRWLVSIDGEPSGDLYPLGFIEVNGSAP